MAEAPRPGSPDPADGPPAALPDGDTLRELIMTKEKELHDINEYRIVQLEALVRERDTALGDAHTKLVKLKDDFGYNLRLIEERDAELATYDTSFQAAKASLRDKEVQLSEARMQLAEREGAYKEEQKRLGEQEAFWQAKLKDARDELDGARWSMEQEMRRARDEADAMRRDLQRQQRERDEDLDAQRREISGTFDEVMRQRDLEARSRDDALRAQLREAEARAPELARTVERLEKENRALDRAAEDAGAKLRDVVDGELVEEVYEPPAGAPSAQGGGDVSALRHELGTLKSDLADMKDMVRALLAQGMAKK